MFNARKDTKEYERQPTQVEFILGLTDINLIQEDFENT